MHIFEIHFCLCSVFAGIRILLMPLEEPICKVAKHAYETNLYLYI